jgi:hypothetical protein
MEKAIAKNEYNIVEVDERMAVTGGTTAATSAAIAAQHTSSYRVKFKRKEFLELVEIAKPAIIYQTGRMHFFAYDGFAMYSFECEDSDFKQKVLHAIEFSNQAWSE